MEHPNIDKENDIALNLIKHIHEKEFINRDLSSLDRIIQTYFNLQNRGAKEEKEVIEFLFSYLDKNGEDASILFTHIQHTQERYNIIKRIYTEYRNKFDFSLVNPALFLTSFELIKVNEKLKRFLYFFTFFLQLFVLVSIFSCYQANQMKNRLIQQLIDEKLKQDNLILKNEKLKNDIKSLDKSQKQLKKELKNKQIINEQIKNDLSMSKQDYENELNNKKQVEEELSTCKKIETELLTCMQLENEMTTCEQLETELTNCKQNSKNEQIIKEHIVDELSTSKQNFENVQQSKIQLEMELLECKQNSENQLIIKKQIENELIQKEKESKKNQLSKLINYKFALFSILDIIFFIISYVFIIESYTNMNYCLTISFIYEILLNFIFILDCSSFVSYSCFSLIFITSIALLAFVSDQNDLSYSTNRLLIIPFSYIIIASVYKYTQIYSIENVKHSIWFVFVCVIFVLEMIYIFYIHYNFSSILPIFIIEITIFVYCCYFEYSPLFISNMAFIAFFFLFLYLVFDTSKYRIYQKFERISYSIGILSLLIQFCIFNLKKNDKIYYIIIVSFIIIEMVLLKIFHCDFYPFLIITEMCFSILSLNFEVLLFVFISIAAIFAIIFAIHESFMCLRHNKISLLFIVFTTITKYAFLFSCFLNFKYKT